VDAVQYVPHGPVDVQALDCDFLACSAYKFFGPHTGTIYGKYDLLDRLPAYKVRPVENKPPYKFETGTQNHEGGRDAGGVEYLEWLAGAAGLGGATRRARLVAALTALADYERDLGGYLIAGLQTVPGLKVWGITDQTRLARRVPTVSFTLPGWHPRAVAEALAAEGITSGTATTTPWRLWNGSICSGRAAWCAGLAHYNTRAEVDRLVGVLGSLKR
jgi:selenocysteine lyase/cysteine desulfurase